MWTIVDEDRSVLFFKSYWNDVNLFEVHLNNLSNSFSSKSSSRLATRRLGATFILKNWIVVTYVQCRICPFRSIVDTSAEQCDLNPSRFKNNIPPSRRAVDPGCVHDQTTSFERDCRDTYVRNNKISPCLWFMQGVTVRCVHVRTGSGCSGLRGYVPSDILTLDSWTNQKIVRKSGIFYYEMST
jgi:hypothetical protein